MNFLLAELERHIDEQSLLAGEQLLDQNPSIQLTELESNLWVVRVQDGSQLFEVEVRISAQKVIDASCECSEFQANKTCGHYAAALISLRKKLQEKKQKKKASRKKKSKQKLTTNVILDQVKVEDLVDFIRDYAKKNRNFSLALKARFTSQVSSMGSKEKYMQLIESGISVARKPNRKISKRGGQKILKLLAELKEQIEDALALGHSAEAFVISQCILEKITPIVKKVDGVEDLLLEELQDSLETLKSIPTAHTAPELLEALWEFAFEEAPKLSYRNFHLDWDLFKLLVDLSTEQIQYQALMDLLDQQLQKYQDEERSPAPILLIQLNLLDKFGQHKIAQELINAHLDFPEVLLYAVQRAIDQKDFRRAKQIGESGLHFPEHSSNRTALEEKLFTVALALGEIEKIISIGQKRFLATLDIEYFHRMKAGIPTEQWLTYSPQILTSLEALPQNKPAKKAITQVLVAEELTRELLIYLQQHPSIERLQLGLPALLPEFQEETYILYKDLLTEYLQEHLGPIPSKKIRKAIQHLHGLEAHDLANKLVDDFRDAFPERHTLMEELAYL